MQKQHRRRKMSTKSTFYYIFNTLMLNEKITILKPFSGALISVSIFSRRWKWGDATLGLLSVVSKIVGGLCTGLARNSLEMYLGKQ